MPNTTYSAPTGLNECSLTSDLSNRYGSQLGVAIDADLGDDIKKHLHSVPNEEEDNPSNGSNAHIERSIASEAGITVGSAINDAVADEIKKHAYLRSLASRTSN